MSKAPALVQRPPGVSLNWAGATKGKTLSLQVSISRLQGPNLKAYGSLITVEDVDLLRENQRVKAFLIASNRRDR
jgi:hypothetical protein